MSTDREVNCFDIEKSMRQARIPLICVYEHPTCDVCGAELKEEYDFYDAAEAKKKAGWKSRKIDGEWCDFCTDCQDVAQ